ncbi:MAG: sugar phosphate isomerase/epimerase [Clostridia bacterium]|nr:sugar phosphate isomerase/epimerase [Clostridia bacterium]
MLISTEIGTFQGLGSIEKTLDTLKEAGFTAYDFSMFDVYFESVANVDDYKEKAQAIRDYADSIGIVCNQSHAPFPTARKGDEAYNKAMLPKIRRAIEVSGILGAKVCVVHPCNDYTATENAELYKNFESCAREAGVKIGVENMWNWNGEENHAKTAACSRHDDFKAHLDLLPKDVFVACLDIGHAEMAGLDTNAVKMVETLAESLEAIHLHDNNCWHDNHAVPYTYNIDFAKVIDALKRVGYKGDITLETNLAKKVPVALIPATAKYMAEIANYFKNEIEK